MPHRLLHLCAAAVVVALSFARPAGAQIFAGEAVEETTGAPLVRLSVRLLHHVDGGTRVVDSTRTDARGLFQFTARAAGAYHLEFGPARSGLGGSQVDSVSGDTTVARRYGVPVVRLSAARPYYEFQVEEPVDRASPRGAPRYPSELRAQNITGTVIAQFVVGTLGRATPGTFRTLQATHPGFVESVRDYVRTMRFRPALIGGVPVPQVVHLPFEFALVP